MNDDNNFNLANAVSNKYSTVADEIAQPLVPFEGVAPDLMLQLLAGLPITSSLNGKMFERTYPKCSAINRVDSAMAP